MRYIWLFAIFVFCMAAACSSDSGNSGQTVARSALARDMAPQVSDEELAAVVSGNTEFALKLFPLLDENPNNNTFFSPHSITQAFALLAPGARGTTLSEIERVLSFPLPQDRLNPTFNKLDLLLAGKTTGVVLSGGLQMPKLSNANAVWGQQGFAILPAYLDTLAVNFGAELHIVDFINSTEASRQTINSWVEEQTNKRIKDLIPSGRVSTDTRFVLTNAVWFKANWALQFPKNGTRDRAFINRDGSSSSVPFMQQVFMVPYAHVAGCQAVDIPYAGHDLSMLVLMPDAGTPDEFLASLTPSILSDITNQLTTKMIDFSMPKFTFTKAASLVESLQSLGMAEVFDRIRSDLSGIDGRRALYVAGVFHKAFIGVDEDGTEATAATAIVAEPPSVPSPELALTVDHPFIFLIRDRQTGWILFMGKVVSLPE